MINNYTKESNQNQIIEFHELKYKILKVYMEVTYQHRNISYKKPLGIIKIRRDWTSTAINKDYKKVLQLV